MPHQDEVLKPILGYEGLYSIDQFGNVYSMKVTNSRRKRVLKPFINNCGYLRVNLYDTYGQAKKHYVHRLVAQTFLDNPSHFEVVNHKDGNRKNNYVENLEWCTQSKNIKYTYTVGCRSSNRDTHIGNNYRGVETIVVDDNVVHTFKNMRDASRYLGKYNGYVSERCRRTGSNSLVIDGKKVIINE